MSTLTHLQQVFEKLKTGYHLSFEDGELYSALATNFRDYANYFEAIGLRLVRHPRDFFYFEAEERDAESKALPKIAVFSYILIDHVASQGHPVEETLMTNIFSLRGLPHFGLDSHRALLRQVEIYEPDHLRAVINYLDRIGWAKWVASEEFKFLRPFYRMLEKCLDLSKLSAERSKESVEELAGPDDGNGGVNA